MAKDNTTPKISTIKAFTVSDIVDDSLKNIEITTSPTKTAYFEGDNFDANGMVVTAYYNNDTSCVLESSDYSISNGTNLREGQTSVTITINYQEKTTTQAITVEEKTITGITINEKPSKLTYIQNKEELDLTGGSLKITYNDGTIENISMTSEEIAVTGFNNKRLGIITLILTYQTKTVELAVEIIEETIEEKAENSKMDNMTAKIKSLKAHYTTDDIQDNYVIIEVEVSGIEKNLNNDKLEYYYYLSSNKNEEEIKDWVKITEKQDNNEIFKFTIEVDKLDNYEELIDSEVIYLYVKEVAIKGGNQSIEISNAMKLEADDSTDIDISMDDVNDESNTEDTKEDDTIANGIIPNAGIKLTSILVIIVLSIIVRCAYVKYKELCTYIK